MLIARRAGIRIDNVAIGIDAVDGLPQQGMPEAIDRMRELRRDSGIDGDVVRFELVDVGLDAPREILEHQVLILHLGAETCGLEQALAIPFALLDAIGHIRSRPQPLSGKGWIGRKFGADHILYLAEQAVVLGVEDVMHGRQADILVSAPVAGDEMCIEKLVVVIAGRIRAVEIGEADFDIAIGDLAGRDSIMRDVVEEGMPGMGGACRIDGSGWIAFDKNVVIGARASVFPRQDKLREAVRTANELAILVRREQRNAGHVLIGQGRCRAWFWPGP